MPFTVQQFFEVFVRFNTAIWPAQLAAYALGAGVLGLALRGGPAAARAVPWLLAGAWAFVGIVYHLVFFAEVNPAARIFAAGFVVQAGLLAWAGARGGLAFGWNGSARAVAGLAVVTYAMLVYPLLGSYSGHGYPASPAFGVTPCPTTIFTFGVLLLAASRVPWWLLVLPAAWSLIGMSAALQLGVREDLGLPVAMALTVVFAILAARRPLARA